MTRNKNIQGEVRVEKETPLRFLGDPILDAGLAACLIHANKEHPSEITYSDWKNWLDVVQEDYEKYWNTVLDVAYTRNGFNNDSWEDDERIRRIRAVFAIARGEICDLDVISEPRPEPGTFCFYYNEEKAVILAARDRIPMLSGRARMNFTINGEGYIPISSWALGCILGFLYTSPLVSGRFLVSHTLDTKLLIDLHGILKSQFVDRALVLSRTQGEKLAIKHCRSRFGEVLDRVFGTKRHDSTNNVLPIKVFFLSNSGQDPGIDIFTYMPSVQTFLKKMSAQRFRRSWNAFVRSFWVGERKRNKIHLPPQAQVHSAVQAPSSEDLTSRNIIYEKLPELPEGAHLFVRYLFKSYVYRNLNILRKHIRVEDKAALALEAMKDDGYEPVGDVLEAFCTHFFPHMTTEKIEKIRTLARTIADLVVEGLEPGAHRDILGLGRINVNHYDLWRRLLIKLSYRSLSAKNRPLLGLDTFVQIFEQGDECVDSNWRLGRDLLQIALLEELHERGYFESHPDEREQISADKLFEETNQNL